MENKPSFQIDFLPDYERSTLIAELQRISKVLGKNSVSKNEIKDYGRCSYGVYYTRFGSLRRAHEEAGLSPSKYTASTDGEILDQVIELWTRTLEREGRTPQRKDLATYVSSVSGDTVVRRFGSWKKALIAAYDKVGDIEPFDESAQAQPNTEASGRKSLSLRKRFFVLKRDEFTCQLCGACGPGVKLEVDHRISIADGGDDSIINLWTLCFDCNRGKRQDSL